MFLIKKGCCMKKLYLMAFMLGLFTSNIMLMGIGEEEEENHTPIDDTEIENKINTNNVYSNKEEIAQLAIAKPTQLNADQIQHENAKAAHYAKLGSNFAKTGGDNSLNLKSSSQQKDSVTTKTPGAGLKFLAKPRIIGEKPTIKTVQQNIIKTEVENKVTTAVTAHEPEIQEAFDPNSGTSDAQIKVLTATIDDISKTTSLILTPEMQKATVKTAQDITPTIMKENPQGFMQWLMDFIASIFKSSGESTKPASDTAQEPELDLYGSYGSGNPKIATH